MTLDLYVIAIAVDGTSIGKLLDAKYSNGLKLKRIWLYIATKEISVWNAY